MKTTGLWVLVFVLGGSAAASQPPVGVAADRWNRLEAQFQNNQPALLEVVRTTAQDGLATEAMLTLVEEGLAKKVEASVLQTAVQRRLEALRAAKKMLTDTGYLAYSGPPQQALMVAVARALESRVPSDALRQTLKAGGGVRAMRIATVIEVGESLKLVGLDDATVEALMNDFVARDLGRGEVLRAARFVEQQHRTGVVGPVIREALWRGTAGAR